MVGPGSKPSYVHTSLGGSSECSLTWAGRICIRKRYRSSSAWCGCKMGGTLRLSLNLVSDVVGSTILLLLLLVIGPFAHDSFNLFRVMLLSGSKFHNFFFRIMTP